jgi:hypothetical protein
MTISVERDAFVALLVLAFLAGAFCMAQAGPWRNR